MILAGSSFSQCSSCSVRFVSVTGLVPFFLPLYCSFAYIPRSLTQVDPLCKADLFAALAIVFTLLMDLSDDPVRSSSFRLSFTGAVGGILPEYEGLVFSVIPVCPPAVLKCHLGDQCYGGAPFPFLALAS